MKSRAKAKHAWRQIPPCACGNPAVKLGKCHEGICQRCLDIERSQKTGSARAQKFLAVKPPTNCAERPLDVYYHPMPKFS